VKRAIRCRYTSGAIVGADSVDYRYSFSPSNAIHLVMQRASRGGLGSEFLGLEKTFEALEPDILHH